MLRKDVKKEKVDGIVKHKEEDLNGRIAIFPPSVPPLLCV